MRKKISKQSRKGDARRKSSKAEFIKEKDAVRDSSNDPVWYSQSPELLRDSSSIPFSWPVGTPLHTSDKMAYDVIPGVCALDLVPCVGTAASTNAPINVAASAIYSWVRHANSGHSNYDSTDLMLYLLAMSNIYSMVTWMQRVYGYISLYDQRNRYLPRGLAAADRINFDSFRDNLANFRYFLNEYITKVASLAVPATMPIFSRLAFLYSQVYCEGPSIKDQMYMFVPSTKGWYKFGLDSQTQAGKLSLTAMTATGAGNTYTFSDVKDYAVNLFNAIWEQEDFGIMSGDIIKAYEGNVIKLSPVPESVIFTPVYDALVLHQIKNAKITNEVDISDIFQLNGYLNQTILIDPNVAALDKAIMYQRGLANKVLSTDFDDPGPDVVIESTRLMPAYDSYKLWFNCGTEVPFLARYISFDANGSIVDVSDSSLLAYDNTTPLNLNTLGILLNRISNISYFKYHPEFFITGYSGTTVANNGTYRVWDIDNYAVLSNEDLIKMHETALLSLFAVPAIAKIQ